MRNTNNGALFRNEKKEQEKHPDARGEAEVVCPHCKRTAVFWLAAWTNVIKQGKRAGQKMQSLKFTAKDDQPANSPEADDVQDDDIPF